MACTTDLFLGLTVRPHDLEEWRPLNQKHMIQLTIHLPSALAQQYDCLLISKKVPLSKVMPS